MLTYMVVPLPDQWPGEPTPSHQRKRSPFGTNWSSTLGLLDAEVRALHGRDVTFALAVRADQIRDDGGVYAKARIQDPSVIVSLTSGADRLSFPCDRFQWWEDNVRAIALAMEALRKVDRYGVQGGRQYQGFKALPAARETPNWDQALATLAEFSDTFVHVGDPSVATVRVAVRHARARTHPDSNGGSAAAFHRVQAAAELISARLGVVL